MEERLFTPGPVKLPERVRNVLSRQIIHHRTQEFTEEFLEVRNLFKRLVHSPSENFVFFASSGTGAMESAVLNFFKEGDRVVVISGGKFGERWVQLGRHWKLDVIEYKVDWGKSFDPNMLEDIIKKNDKVKGILYQISESSTGAYNDPKLIKEVVGDREIITVADAITALGVYDIDPIKEGIDVLVGGSQKALMLPPGLSMLWFSDRAEKNLTDRAFYFSIKKELPKQKEGQTAFTPAIMLILALKESLSMLLEKGMDRVESEYRKISYALTEAFKSCNLSIFPENPAISMTVIYHDKADIIRKKLLQKGIRVAGGQDRLKGKIFRISHMGVDLFDIGGLIFVLDSILAEEGIIKERGKLIKTFSERI